MHLNISLVRIQPATRAMLQKKLIMQNTKLLLKWQNLKSSENLNKYDFIYVQAKSDIRQFPNYFLTIFDFTLPFFKDLSQDG